MILYYRDAAVKLSPYHLLNSENKPVVLEKLKQILVVYGEAESEQFRSQANNFSQVCCVLCYLLLSSSHSHHVYK